MSAPRMVTDPATIAAILNEAAANGHVVPLAGAHGGEQEEAWTLPTGAIQHEWTDGAGRAYAALDVNGMLPIYRDIYRWIVAERLTAWEMSEGVELIHTSNLILYRGPAERLKRRHPRAHALDRLEAADQDWGRWLDAWWRGAAAEFEDRADRFWSDLRGGHAAADDLRALVHAKAHLNAIGVDSLLPDRTLTTAWLTPHLPESLLTDILDGCYLPASGAVAYDRLELACWRLALALSPDDELPVAARAHFIHDGLFLHYDALNPDNKRYYFETYPLTLARQYRQVAPAAADIEARMAEVLERAWRRRRHREWAEQQLAAVADAEARQRLLVLHNLLGSGRDFDEEKRRLNAKLWRDLFALADGLNVSLGASDADLDGLTRALDRAAGSVTVAKEFTEFSGAE